MNPTAARPTVLVIALALLTVGFAGCIGTGAEGELGFEDAREQAHTTAEPEEASTVRVGLIEPASEGASQGKHNVTFLAWDEIDNEPIEDASFTLDAFMPMMGHGTSPEEDPEHLGNGVYRGSTNLMMGGEWLIYLNATLADGTELHFEIPITAEGGGHGGHMDHDGPSTQHDSYEDAKQADGETFAPEQDSPLRLKLLEPVEREVLEQGETNVTVLFFDGDADEPVEHGNATLDAQMPAMDHGTSPEEDPVHAAHGVWKGMTTLAMNGTWVLEIGLTPEHGEPVSWAINVTVGEGGMDHGDMDEEEPAFEPYEVTFEDEVSGPDYAQSYGFDVEAANATLTMNGTLGNATALTDELTVDLLDPEGDELGSFTLDADTSEASLTVEDAPAEGEHEVQVTGQAVNADYTVTVYVTPP